MNAASRWAATPTRPEGRQAFLRSPVAIELMGFMLSPAYEAAFAPDPEEQS